MSTVGKGTRKTKRRQLVLKSLKKNPKNYFWELIQKKGEDQGSQMDYMMQALKPISGFSLYYLNSIY